MIGSRQAVDFLLGPLFGHGDQDAIAQVGVPAAEVDTTVISNLADLEEKLDEVADRAEQSAEERVLDLLLPPPPQAAPTARAGRSRST